MTYLFETRNCLTLRASEDQNQFLLLLYRTNTHLAISHIRLLLSRSFILSIPLWNVTSISTITNINIIIIILDVLTCVALLSDNSVLQLASAQEHILLETVTDQGTFKVIVIWTSNTIGSANMFEIHFIDPDTGSEIEHIKYDISVYRDDKVVEVQRLDQVSMFQEFFFEEDGSYVIRIENIEDLGERATIPIQVTPEFGLDVSVLSASALGVGMFAAWIYGGKNLFRRFIN
jgi:hypothetical protein